MARDGEIIQRQHFCHYGDKSGCNNNAIFSDRVCSRFLPSQYACLLCGTRLLHVKMDPRANRNSLNLVAKRTSGRCHTRQNVRNNIKSKRIHNISFPQFRAMVNTCSADGDRVCCDEALVMRHWEHRGASTRQVFFR